MSAETTPYTSAIPIIDINAISVLQDTDALDNQTLRKKGLEMKEALQTYGFFYANNHGITKDQINDIFSSAKGFFDESEVYKAHYIRGTKGDQGWVGMEAEKSDPNLPGDLKESFSYHPADDRNSRLKSEFNTNCGNLFSLCCKLSYHVTDALSLALGFPERSLSKAYEHVGQKDNQTLMTSLMYPPIPPHYVIKPGQVRLGEHTDDGMVTILFQDDAGGLEMNTPNSGYVPVTPIADTIIVFVGEQMQMLTADALVAPKHKVIFPVSDIEARKLRQSTAFSIRADDNYVLKCLDGSQTYKPMSSLNYLIHRQMKVIV